MEKMLEILRIALPDADRWALEEALDDYVKKIIKDCLDFEFDRGSYRRG
jgi:hypothetical protein